MLVLSIPLSFVTLSITWTAWLLEAAHLIVVLGSNWSLLLHQEWHTLNKELQIVLEFFLVGKVSPLGTLCIRLTELLETTFVLSGFVLQLTNLLDLVMVDG